MKLSRHEKDWIQRHPFCPLGWEPGHINFTKYSTIQAIYHEFLKVNDEIN